MSKSKSWRNGDNTGNFTKIENQKIKLLGNVIKKAHAKFQEASSIRNTQNSRGTIQ